jgi:predicted HTH transcriptional regulator
MGLWELRGLVKRLPLAVEPQTPLRAIPTVPSPERRSPYGARPTAELVTVPEDGFLEQKQTLLYDMRTKQANQKLQDAVMDRICGFWNAKGGTLLIGVEDRTGVVTGLGPDLKLARDLDDLCNRLSQKLRNDLPSIAPFVRSIAEPVGAELVLRIDVPAGDRPLYLNDRLMVRINNTTQELKGQSQLDYIRSRFDRT